jgi:hypothetical protein
MTTTVRAKAGLRAIDDRSTNKNTQKTTPLQFRRVHIGQLTQIRSLRSGLADRRECRTQLPTGAIENIRSPVQV